MASAVELVRRFRELRALVIGDAMLDSYLEGTAARICTEGPVPVVRHVQETRQPGGAANSAANVRALGADVIFLGIVGADVGGMMLRAALRECGVDDRRLVEDDRVTTLHKLRILADGQYVVRFDEGETRHISDAAQQRLLDHLDAVFSDCDVVIISDYCYGVVTDALLARIRALRTTHPIPLIIDSKDLRRFHSAGATVVTPNHLEARLAIAGRQVTSLGATSNLDLHEIEQVARQLLQAIDTEYAAITLARDGVLLVDRAGMGLHLPAHPVAQANDVGAGDSLTAALALALAAGGSCAAAARIGIDAAGIAVSRRRTAIVQQGELLQRVSLHDHPTPPSLDTLRATLREIRAAGKTIVFTNGVFDILHAGHVQFLREARQLGDLLVVGVNSDRSARRLKGPHRPINSEGDRLALVAALDAVDHALLFDEDTPSELIRALCPHIHAKGSDYADAALPEAEAVAEVGGRIVIVPLVGDHSTSGVIERIVAQANFVQPREREVAQ